MDNKIRLIIESLKRLVVAVLWKSALVLSSPPKKPRLEWVKVQGGPIWGTNLLLDIRDGASREMYEGTYDRLVYDVIQQSNIINEGSLIWDIGAHFGYHSLMFAKMVEPSGKVIAFEPNPYNAEHFRKHMDRNPVLSHIIDLKPVAVSEANGEQMLRCSSSYFLSTIAYLDDNKVPSERISKTTYESLDLFPVETVTADRLLEMLGEPPVLIKIDAEGAEAKIINGATRLLSTYKPALVIEIHNLKNMYLIQPKLLELGYQLRFEEDPLNQSSSRGFLFASDTPCL